MNPTLLLFLVLIVGLLLKLPIAVAIGVSTLSAAVYAGLPPETIASRLYASVNSFPLLAIPFFMLAGSLMSVGGMSRRLVRLSNAVVGTLAGGLAHVQILGSAFFAALSGSAPATTAAVGSVLIPEMEKEGYPKEFSAAVQSISGTIGTIIPPSIPMVVFGVMAGVSIGEMFAAGIIPGILKALGLMLFVGYTAKKEDIGTDIEREFSVKELWQAFKESILALLVPIIILGGIYSGIFTPTEAGAVAVFYGFFVGLFIYKELKFEELGEVFARAANTTVLVLLIVAMSGAFSWFIKIEGIANVIAQIVMNLPGGKFGFLFLSVFILLFMGCFIEAVANVLIFTPIFLPIALEYGIDPIHFGIIIIIFISTGMSTPPLGENLYIAAGIADISFEDVLTRIGGLLAVVIVVDLLVTFIPSISLLIPRVFF